MAANCKNTASLPVLCWQDNWTPDIDRKKAPTEAGAGKSLSILSVGPEMYHFPLAPAIHHMG
jgi:hypothetical protein